MADRARQKEKKRLKRLEKQKAVRKLASVTALQKIAANGGELECWVNEHWQEMGMVSMNILGHAGGGRYAMSAFLIDIWCVGLKDAWGKPEIGRAEFMEDMLTPWSKRMPLEKLEVAEARRLVAAGVRFARQNGFRLPAGWEKWASILGGLGDIASVDLTGFTKDGKLLYMGTGDFIRKNLIACTPEEFFSHPDHDWVAPPDDLPFSMAGFDDADALLDDAESVTEGDDDEEESLEQAESVLEGLVGRTAEVVREWCHAQGVEPHPHLDQAAGMVVVKALITGVSQDETTRGAMMQQILDTVPPEADHELGAAINQINAYVASFKSPGDAFKRLGIGAGQSA
ncbi:MAG: hypothetical protein JWP03_171 [Phycisphaerales bacterium]|jgi:hypothetical protein|nr:hypothetical protein [Phycisphaerales bacterium]